MKAIYTLVTIFLVMALFSSAACAQFDGTFKNAEKKELKIQFVDSQGKGVAGASVKLIGLRSKSNPGAHYGVRELIQFESDSEGYAILQYPKAIHEELETGFLTLEIAHPKFAKDRVDQIPVDGSMERIELTKGATIEPVVTLNGERIKTYKLFLGFEEYGIDISDPNKTTATVKNGDYPAYVRYETADGGVYYSDPVNLTVVDGSVYTPAFELYPGLSMKGMMKLPNGGAVKNGEVMANMLNEVRDFQRMNQLALTLFRPFICDVQEDGSFELSGLPKGYGELIATCDGYVSKPIEYLTQSGSEFQQQYKNQNFVLSKDGQKIVVPMEASSTFSGQVVNEDGDPVVGVTVGLSPNVRWGNYMSSIFMIFDPMKYSDDPSEIQKAMMGRYTCKTDERGAFRIEEIPCGDQRYSISSDEYELKGEDRRSRAKVHLPPGEDTKRTVRVSKKQR